MEYPLRADFIPLGLMRAFLVSILVLMEYPLRGSRSSCFLCSIDVSILVLMEYPLRVAKGETGIEDATQFQSLF